MALLDSILQVESGGDPYAKNPRSSATGLGQFIAGTWLDMMQRHRPDLVAGKSPDEILALRNDPALSRQMTDAYANENTQVLQKAGLEPSPGNVYLSHFAGPGTAVKLLQANPTTPVASIMDPQAIAANPFLRGMTVADLQMWAGKKMGGPSPTAQPQAPGPLSPTAMPANTIPDLPIALAGDPAAAQQTYNQPEPQPQPQSFWSTMPADQGIQQQWPMINMPPMPRRIPYRGKRMRA